jgi:cobalamin biosynthesis protein CobD/CbiB
VVARLLPAKLITKLERITDEKDEQAPDELQQIWNSCFKRFIFTMLINSGLCIAIMAIMYYFGQPIIESMVPAEWVHPVTALVGVVICGPFLWMLMRAGGDSPEVNKLWYSSPHWRVRLTAYGVLRIVITAIFVSFFVDYAIPWTSWLGIVALIAILLFIFHSSVLEKHSNKMVKNFTDNLTARERLKEGK